MHGGRPIRPNGDSLRMMIIRAGISMNELAERLGVHKSDISHATSRRWRQKRYGKLRKRLRKVLKRLVPRAIHAAWQRIAWRPHYPLPDDCDIANRYLRDMAIRRANDYALYYRGNPLPPLIPLIARLLNRSRATIHLALDPIKAARYRIAKETQLRARELCKRILARPDLYCYD